MWISVLWGGLRVAMWITHVGGKFRHGLLEKSLKHLDKLWPRMRQNKSGHVRPRQGQKSAISGRRLQWIFPFRSRFSVQFSKEMAPRCGENCPTSGQRKKRSILSRLWLSWFFGPEQGKISSLGAMFLFIFLPCMWGWCFKKNPHLKLFWFWDGEKGSKSSFFSEALYADISQALHGGQFYYTFLSIVLN